MGPGTTNQRFDCGESTVDVMANPGLLAVSRWALCIFFLVVGG